MYSSTENPKYLLNRLFAFIVAMDLVIANCEQR